MAATLSTSAFSSITSIRATRLPLTPATAFNLLSLTGVGDKHGRDRRGGAVYCVSLKGKAKNKVSKIPEKRERYSGGNLVFSEGRDGDESHGLICPGCGVFMQDRDPNIPGYYIKKKEANSELLDEEDGLEGLTIDELEGEEEAVDGSESEFGESEGDADSSVEEDKFDWESDDWEGALDDEEEGWKELDGFAAPGAGYGNITEQILEQKNRRKRLSKSERKRLARETERERDEVRVCARCHSLRNYGQVKNQTAENLIPDFDFERLISSRLMRPTGNADATVVVMVVDCVDFDGSFPKRAARSLFKALEDCKTDPKLSKKLPKLVLVATKVDLLPSQISPTRLDKWVRHRARAAGAPKLNGVYLVSSRKDLGIRNLLSFIKDQAGPRGHVWVIGSQNAGKSTLINAFAKKGGAKALKLTEAAVPGTTLGILRIGGILPAKAKMYDTPGLLHSYLLSMRLNREEQKMIEMRKELQPRSYRIKVGQAIHIGGLVRLDLDQASVETIYVTVWASKSVSLHLGKVENADEIWSKHVGARLQPPISPDRVEELGKWVPKEFKISGSSWDVNSVDLAIAGLGWFSLGLKGQASVKLWTYDGVGVYEREALVLDRAPFLERPGFWLTKTISDAVGNQSKLQAQRKKQIEDEDNDYDDKESLAGATA